MERRYVGVRTVGNPTQIFNRIRQVVQNQSLTRMIPAVKFERKPRGEFYVFLAVEDTEGTYLPDDVVTVLQYAGLKSQHFWPIAPDEVKPMTSSPELETHSLNALTYKPLWFNDPGDPFDLSGTSSDERDTGDPSLGERYDRLLHWLSANAEGTWRTFARVCDVLKLAEDIRGSARSIFRRLILLGYIESAVDGQKWSICPSTLVQCAADPNVCFLTGQQTPKLIEQLKKHWEVESIPQPDYQGPSCVKVHGVFPDASINDFRFEQPEIASVQLARLLPNLESWKDTLTTIDRLSTGKYNVEIWNGSRFTLCDTFYEKDEKYVGESGMYRLTRGETSDTYQIVLYFDQANQRWLRGDWYGLRFLAYDAARRDFEVRYDSSANNTWIPVDERWPMLYERALVLASGILPYQAENPKWLRYSGISRELIQLLTEKLNVSIREI